MIAVARSLISAGSTDAEYDSRDLNDVVAKRLTEYFRRPSTVAAPSAAELLMPPLPSAQSLPLPQSPPNTPTIPTTDVTASFNSMLTESQAVFISLLVVALSCTGLIYFGRRQRSPQQRHARHRKTSRQRKTAPPPSAPALPPEVPPAAAAEKPQGLPPTNPQQTNEDDVFSALLFDRSSWLLCGAHAGLFLLYAGASLNFACIRPLLSTFCTVQLAFFSLRLGLRYLSNQHLARRVYLIAGGFCFGFYPLAAWLYLHTNVEERSGTPDDTCASRPQVDSSRLPMCMRTALQRMRS